MICALLWIAFWRGFTEPPETAWRTLAMGIGSYAEPPEAAWRTPPMGTGTVWRTTSGTVYRDGYGEGKA